jgi:hypothetical protein
MVVNSLKTWTGSLRSAQKAGYKIDLSLSKSAAHFGVKGILCWILTVFSKYGSLISSHLFDKLDTNWLMLPTHTPAKSAKAGRAFLSN